MPKLLLNPLRNNLSIEGLSLRHDELLDQPVRTDSDVTFHTLQVGDIYATGNVTFTGNITEIETQHVNIQDNIIDINSGNENPLLTGGIRIQRGAGLIPFDIFYDETSKLLRIGFETDLQAVSTREDNPVDGYLSVWNAAAQRFDSRNALTVPLDLQNDVTFRKNAYFGTTSGGTVPSIQGDTIGNLFLNAYEDVVLGAYGAPPGKSVIIPAGRQVNFGSSNVYSDAFGNLVLDGPKVVFPGRTTINWGGAANISAANSGNDISVNGTNINFNPGSLLSVNTSAPIEHAGVATFLPLAGGSYSISTVADLVFTSTAVVVPSLTLNRLVHFTTDVAGNMSMESAGDMFFSPAGNFVLNPNKRLCLGGNTETFLSVDSTSKNLWLNSTNGITLNANSTYGVVVPPNVALNFGNNGSIWENSAGTAVISSTKDVMLNPGPGKSVLFPSSASLTFGEGERLYSDGLNLTISATSQINLTAPMGINVGVNIPILFGDADHRIFQDNSGNIYVDSNRQIHLRAADLVVVDSNVLAIGNARVFQDLADNALTFSSGDTVNLTKNLGAFWVTSDVAATSAGTAALKTDGGVFVGKNLMVSREATFYSTVNVANAVTMGNALVPLLVTNSSASDGTAIGFTASWDFTGGYNIGRGNPDVGAGRSMMFTLPTFVNYGIGSHPSFFFGSTAGDPYLVLDDSGMSLTGACRIASTSDRALVVQGNASFNAVDIADSVVAAGNSFNVTSDGATIATKLSVNNSLSVAWDNFNQPLLDIDNVGNTFYLATLFQDNVSVRGTVIADKKLYANAGLTLGGDIDLQSHRVLNLQNPIYDNDPATKYYVDTFLQSLSAKEAVNVATTGNLDIANPVYNVDDVVLHTGDRLLVKDQTNAVENGIYTLDAGNFLVRSVDMADGSSAAGVSVFVIDGTVNSDVGFLFIGSSPLTVGQDDLIVRPYTGASQINVANGLSKYGNTLSINVDNTTVAIDGGNNLSISPSYISNVGLTGGSYGVPVATSSDQSHVTKLGVVTSGTWNANTLTVPYGGTGTASLAAGRIVVGNGTNPLTTTSAIFIDPLSDYVGIQTNVPKANLHLLNAGGTTTGTWFRIEDNAPLTTQSSGIGIVSSGHSAKISLQSNGTLYVGQEDFSNASRIALSTQKAVRMTVDYSGNVVVGTGNASPGNIFTVYGNSTVNGSATVKGTLTLPTVTVSSDSFGNAVLNSPVVKISNGFDVGADATLGNFKLVSTVSGETSIVSSDRNTGLGLTMHLKTSATSVSASCMNGGFLVPGNLQIGGVVGDTTTGFSLYTVNNNLHLTPGVMGASVLFDAPMSFGAGLSLYDSAKPNDFIDLSVSTTYLYLQTNASTVTSPYTVLIGGGTNEIITTFTNKSNSASVTYDPTDVSEYSGGTFTVSEGILTTIGSEIRLSDILRFSLGNSTEGVLGNNGWYYLGILGVGRTTVSLSLSWRIRLDYDGVSHYEASVLNYDRNVASLVVYANAGNYFLFVRVSSGPCRISILESPVVFYLNGNYEGGGAAPNGQYSGYTSSWTLDLDSSQAQSNANLDFGVINVLGQATINNASLQGQTTISGDLLMTGNPSITGTTFTFSDPVTSLPRATIGTEANDNLVTVYGTTETAPGFVIDQGQVSGSLTMSPSTSAYPNALLLSHDTNDPSSQIVFATRGNAAVLVDNNGNTQILSTTDSIDSGAVSFRVRGGSVFDGHAKFDSPVYLNELRMVNSAGDKYASLFADADGNFSASGLRITNVGNPQDAGDAVNKGFVEGLIQGLSPKDSVDAASAGSNYDIANVVTVVDGVTLGQGDRVLFKDQSDPVENGLYVIMYGAPPIRAYDLPVGSHAAATYVFVSEGVVNNNSGWLCSSTPDQDVVGVNALTFTQFSGAGQFIAGAGLTKMGNVYSVVVDNFSLEITGNNALRVSSAIAGTGLTGGGGGPLVVSSITHLTALGTITTGTWNGGIIGMAYGGTGSTAFGVGRIPFSNGASLTQGTLYFDDVNVRLGINTTSPVSGLTLQDRDISVVQTTATSSSILLSSSVTNYTFGLRSESSKLVISGGAGNNKSTLTDMVSLDNTGMLTVSNGVRASSVVLGNVTRFSGNTLESLVGGAFSLDVFSLNNEGSHFNFYGGLGTSTNSADSEFMRVGYYNANYILQTSATGIGTVRNLCLQAGSNTNQFVIGANGNAIFNAPVYVNTTTDATSTVSGGALTVLGGASVNETLYARNFVCTATTDAAATIEGGLTAGKVTVSGTYQNYSLTSDADGTALFAGTRSASDASVAISSNDANNGNNVLLRVFGNGKSVAAASEWLQLGFESASAFYAIRTSQGGAASARPLVLSATLDANQITLNTDGSTAFSSKVTFAGNLVVSSTQDATAVADYANAALGIAGGLTVVKSITVGNSIQTPSALITGNLDLNAAGSLDKVSLSYTSGGRFNVYNNATNTVNIHAGTSVGPNSPNQEKLVLGYMDASAYGVQSFASGTSVVKDLVFRAGANVDQVRLYATDGSIRFGGDVVVASTTASTASGVAALVVSGGISVDSASNFYSGASFGTAGSTGSLVDFHGATSWSFSSVDATSVYMRPVGSEGAFCFASSTFSPLLTVNSVGSATVTSSVPFYTASLSTKAVSVQNGSGTDMFFFDTVNHVLDVQSGRISNVAYPQLPSDATCKSYVDNLVKGLNLKGAANVASNGNVDLTKSLTTLDDIALQEGYRVLLLAQTNSVENGIYVVLSNNMLVRTDDLAAGSRAAGAFCFVTEGTIRGDKGYVCITDPPNDVVGVNALSFSQFNGNVISAGLGLYKDGNNFLNINLDAFSGLSFNGNYLRVDPSFAGTGLQLSDGVLSMLPVTAVGTITSGAWQGSTIEMSFGGTGNTTFLNQGVVFSDGSKLLTSAKLNWDDGKVALGVNGAADPNLTGDGITLHDRDAVIAGLDRGMYFAGGDARYKWGLRPISVGALSTLRCFASEPWTTISMSKDGNVVVLLAETGYDAHISTNGGADWDVLVNDGATHTFSRASLSNDGSVILLCASEEYLYLSRDSGATFQRVVTDVARAWEYCSVSDNGQYMLASASTDAMFASNDAGQTWRRIDSVPTDLGFVHVSKDGNMQFAGYLGGSLYASTDYGNTFSVRADVRNGNWRDLAESRNSNAMVLFEDAGSLFVSNDLGVTWTEKLADAARNWVSVDISPDGSVIAAADRGGNVWFSANYGGTWQTLFGGLVANWNVVQVADDDLGVMAAGANVPVYVTKDGGATFTTVVGGNVTVPAMSLSPSGYLYIPIYQGSVMRYMYVPSTALVMSGGDDGVKSNLTDFVVFSDQKRLGIGYGAADAGSVQNTLDVQGTLYVSGTVQFDTPLPVSSGGTGASSLVGLLIGNGTSPIASTGKLSSGQIAIGASDGSGNVVLESGDVLRGHLGLGIGVNVQAWSGNLDSISSLTPLNNYFIMGNGTSFVTATAQSAANTMGLGRLAYLDNVNDAYWSGTSLSVAHGGTGNTTFSNGKMPFYDGTALVDSGIGYDSTNGGLVVNGATVPAGSGIGVYGGDVSILTTSDAAPNGILLHNPDTTVAWRIRRNDDESGTGSSSLIVSGGVQSSDKNALVDRLTLNSAGDLSLSSATDSASVGTGALNVAGGLSVGKTGRVGGKLYVVDATDATASGGGSLVTQGGLRVEKTISSVSLIVSDAVSFDSTVDATSATVAGTVISGGLGVSGKIWNRGGMVVETASSVGSRASGVTVSCDSSAWTADGLVVDADRHLSLVSNVASSGTCFNMRNLTATNGWDVIVEGSLNNRFVLQSAPASGANGTTWFTLDSVTGSLTLYGTNDASATTAASLHTAGGIHCAKGIVATGSTVSSLVNGSVVSAIGNDDAGVDSCAVLELRNDGVDSASLFLNSSARTADGGANAATLRNDAGALHLQSQGGLGVTLAASTGDVTVDGAVSILSTLDATSSVDGGSATFAGGLAVAKSAYVGGDLTVTGAVTMIGAVSAPTVTTAAADMVNITSLSIYSSKLVVVNNQYMLYLTFTVSPTVESLNTQFTFTLPGRTAPLVQNLDLDTGQCSGFTDTTNLVVLQNVLCTGVPQSSKAVVKFQSVSTSTHYLQAFVSYAV